MNNIENILAKENLAKEDIITLLQLKGEDRKKLYEYSAKIKEDRVGKKVYFRGLIEFSNICGKNCLYCGIRKDNDNLHRYNLDDDEIINAVKFACNSKYGSIVLQSGEITGLSFIDRIDLLLKKIRSMTHGELGITLSLGEQTDETYQRWFDSGAHRYLLRIETTNKELYHRIHPNNNHHSYENRVKCLYSLKKIGYQLGTGIMVGLPFQTIEDIANDILFMKEIDVDMIGLGPYIEHPDTPLFDCRSMLLPLEDRLELAFKTIAILRIMMKDINIAASTALQAIDKIGREKAIMMGANVIMPNITPGKYRDYYKLYEGKPCTTEEAQDCSNCLEARITMTDHIIAYGERGDSVHYQKKRL